MSKYGMMTSYDKAIEWVEHLEVPDGDVQNQVLNRMRYERDLSIPVKPKYHKGRSIRDWYTCGNCGHGLHEIQSNYCQNCGRRIGWDSIRCLTGKRGTT